jgi:PPK2 family polyphosphate:nucleotide phosphotransferase
MFKLKEIDPNDTGPFNKKEDAAAELEQCSQKLNDLMYLMFAENRRSLLVILQGIDTSGKDGVIRHIFSSVNPQGLKVHSFKQPSENELKHDYLWRCHRVAPESGETAVFNRSYYEDVTTTLVHRKLLNREHLPKQILDRKDFFEIRYRQINDFEKMMSENGTLILKFLLHISKDEQKQRLEERIKDPTKNWKFSLADTRERKYWDEYQKAFELMLNKTNTRSAPWKIIPANKKWYRNYLVSKTIVETLSDVKMKFPKLSGSRIRID